jgi:hypothetical protein
VHIWNLDGTVARVIDVGQGLTAFAHEPDVLRHEGYRRHRKISAVVRDVSWHPYEGVIVFLPFDFTDL